MSTVCVHYYIVASGLQFVQTLVEMLSEGCAIIGPPQWHFVSHYHSLLNSDHACTFVLAGRCIYPYGDNVTHRILNQTQSREISCFSRHMRGSVYHHYMLEASTGENPLPVWDILHCEAATHSLQNLNVHRDTDRSGVQVLISSGPCMSGNQGSHGENCTFVILYLNISYYDHHNGSTIPLCGFQRPPHHNLECFCIHYILGETRVKMAGICGLFRG